MVRQEDDPKRLEVAEDGRSVGYWEESEDGRRVFHPIILWGFKLDSYISSESGPRFRGLKVDVKTNGGRNFLVDWKHKDLLSFKKCHEACVEQGFGDMFEYKPFDESLWSDLMVRLKFISVEQGVLNYREPARNEGYQMAYLKEQKIKNATVTEDDIEYVTKNKVIGIKGIKQNPVHMVVEGATPEVDWKKPSFTLSGIKGFFKVFLPPHTSLDKEQRTQQTVILTATLVEHFYPFIVDQLGECPGMMLASYEPETMKSTLSQVALKYFSVLDNFMESGSTKESMDLQRSTSTNFCLWDDVESAGGKEHGLWVGSMNGAAKHTIGRGKSCKMAGTLINKNINPQETIHPKVLEGRLLWFLMSKSAFHEQQDLEENILAQQRHRLAMMETSLPTDFLVKMVRHFIIQPGDEFSRFQDIHREACMLLEIHRKQYRKRKLKSNALVLAVFMMIEIEVEESDDEHVKRMFVEVYGDRDSFLEAFLMELTKTDELEREMRSRQHPRTGRLVSQALDEEVRLEEYSNLDNNSSINNVMDCIKDMSIAEVTRYLKIFHKQTKDESVWTLGIAHPRIKKDQRLKNMAIKLVGQQTTQQFTKMSSDQWQGRGATQAAVCTVMPFLDLRTEVKDRLKQLFEPLLRRVFEQKEVEAEEELEEDSEEEDVVRPSEDYPQYSQSQNQNTLNNCKLCDFCTRNKNKLRDHIEIHPKCDKCDKRAENEDALAQHKDSVHNHFKCTKCLKDVPISATVEHLKMHNTQEQYNRIISDASQKTEPPKGWNLFLKIKKTELRSINRNLSHQLATSQVSAMWKSLSKAEKKMWNMRAMQERDDQATRLEPLVGQGSVQARDPIQDQMRDQAENQPRDQNELHVRNQDMIGQGSGEARDQTRNEVTMTGQSSNQARDPTMEHQDLHDAVENVLAAEMDVSVTDVENFVFGDDSNDNELDLTDTLVTRKRKERLTVNSNIEESSEDEEEQSSSKRHKTIGGGVGRVSRDLDCPHCGHEASNNRGLAEHMKKEHPMRQMLLGPRGSNELALLPAVPLAEPASHPEIVLVRLKKLEWPARVLSKTGDKVEVVLFNSRKTTTEVPEDQTRPFAMANISSKNSELRRAYEQAQKLV